MMKILQLAPHSFYVDRGTPIDVLLVLRVLCQRQKTSVDILVYNEGKNIDLPNLNIIRTAGLPGMKNIRPGFSFKKIIADVLMFFKAWQLVRKNNYDVIHAGEEAVFMAMFFKRFYKTPYVYDLDSSIAQQMVEQKPGLKRLANFFNRMETKAIQKSLVNLPVCNALAKLCDESGSKKTVTIHDISQLENPSAVKTHKIHKELGLPSEKLLLIYIGNLEVYQGIDLLIEGFAKAAPKTNAIDLIIIGGVDEHIKAYKQKVETLGVADRVHFLGPRPFKELDSYLAEADVLACPRIRGVNTPMKIFPYLHSGKAIIATDLYTHNQLLSNEEVCLVKACADDFGDAIIRLAENPEARKELGDKGREFVEKNHTFLAHEIRLNDVYDWIGEQLNQKNTG